MDDSSAKDNLSLTNASASTSFYSAEQQVVVASRNLANAQRDYDEHYAQYAKDMDELYVAWITLQDVNDQKDENPGRYTEEWDWVMKEYPGWGVMKRGDIAAVQSAYENARRKFEALSTNLTDAQYAYELANASQRQSSTSNSISVKSGEKLVSEAKVTAPISGYLTSLNVAAGDLYGISSGSLFTISDTSTYEIEATVDQYDIASIKEGLKCVVRFDTTGDEEFEGILSYVAMTPASSATSQMAAATGGSANVEYPVKITLKSADERLRVGMTSKVNIIIEEKKNVLCVPYDCVREEEGRTYVIVMNEDGTTKEVDVKSGMEGDYYIEITGEGISEGLKVQAVSSGSAYETLMEMISNEASVQVTTD
ncbi:MAG: HlyD family efflux transporter periplasmic adaptor subunit [Parasporobacterium sp.]|nr:HlyD family efflux transporter periplasmic adaptor subunit [Parasporobacterium sp.]